MHSVAAIFDSLVLYRYSLILALAAGTGICFFLACCTYVQIPSRRASACALAAVLLSLPLSRLIYWYERPNGFSSFLGALTSSTEAFALAGVFAGCSLAVLAFGGTGNRKKMLDCMCVAGCAGLALGRLGCFFTTMDRGQILVRLTELPWAYPVVNTSGQPEYRFATFLFQAGYAALLGIFLAVMFFRKKTRPGEITILFLLFYSASQMLLDSTRYDSLYLRSNGFVSLVQVLSAMGLAIVLTLLNIRAVYVFGWKLWMPPLWSILLALFAGVGYMEYYVQRHGQEAALAYTAMGIYLAAIVSIGLLLWYLLHTKNSKKLPVH